MIKNTSKLPDKGNSPDKAKSEGPGIHLIGGAIATVLVAAGIGVLRNADNLIRPAIRGIDDGVRASGRSYDHAGSAAVRKTDEATEISIPETFASSLASEAAKRAVSYKLCKMIDEIEPAAQQEKTGFHVSGTFSMREAVDAYELGKDGWYHLSATRSTDKTKMSINGVELPAETTTDTKLPNRENGEYNRKKLILDDNNRPVLREQIRFTADEGKFFDVKNESAVEFVEGDWKKYSDGGDVVLRYTEAGIKKSAESLQAQIENQFVTAFADSLGRADGDESPAVSFKFEFKQFSNWSISINRNTIRSVADGPVDGIFELSLTLDPLAPD